jgi:hypothetical protein
MIFLLLSSKLSLSCLFHLPLPAILVEDLVWFSLSSRDELGWHWFFALSVVPSGKKQKRKRQREEMIVVLFRYRCCCSSAFSSRSTTTTT